MRGIEVVLKELENGAMYSRERHSFHDEGIINHGGSNEVDFKFNRK